MAYDNTNKWAIWTKTAKSGLVYKSWVLNVEGKEYNISMFDNDKSWNPNRPDFNIIIEAIEKDNIQQKSEENKPNNKSPESFEWDISVEDIPF